MWSHTNIGIGKDVTIREMAKKWSRLVVYEDKLTFNTTMPDSTLRNLIDITRLVNMGWKYAIELEEWLDKTYK